MAEQLQKVFVGGLNQEANEDTLTESFHPYGTIIDVSVLRDATGRSRGFGFVVFEDALSVDEIMNAKKDGTVFHVNNGLVEVKRALPKVDRSAMQSRDRGAYSRSGSNNIGVRKIFVGGLASSTTSVALEEYFNKFGQVLESSVLMDKVTGRSRGFGFVVFEDEDSADKVCALKDHKIDAKLCEVRKAEPRSQLMNRRDRDMQFQGYRNQNDQMRMHQQRGFNAPPENIGNLGNALQLLNSLQSLVGVQQLLGQNVPGSQYQVPVQGMQQYPAQIPTGYPMQNAMAPNANQGNILNLLQNALGAQGTQPAAHNPVALNLQNSNQLGALLGSTSANSVYSSPNVAGQSVAAQGIAAQSVATQNTAAPNQNTLALLQSLARMGQPAATKQEIDGQDKASSLLGAAGNLDSSNQRYYDESYMSYPQGASGYGPVRYPARSDSKSSSYRPY